MRPGEVEKHVLALRDRDVHITAQQRRATRPEKVLHYRRHVPLSTMCTSLLVQLCHFCCLQTPIHVEMQHAFVDRLHEHMTTCLLDMVASCFGYLLSLAIPFLLSWRAAVQCLPPGCLLAACPAALPTSTTLEMCAVRMMDVRWRRLDTEVQGVTGLSDVLQIDLGDFCRSVL